MRALKYILKLKTDGNSLNTATIKMRINKKNLRNSTDKNYVIFWDNEPLKTIKSGAINAKGGILLTAWVEELNAWIEHRSNNTNGYKGFSFGDDKRLTREIRERLCYKY